MTEFEKRRYYSMLCKRVRHFKGKEYMPLAIVEHSETGEELIAYKALYGRGKLYVRPAKMFLSTVNHEKHPEATQIYRFEVIEN